MMASKRAVTFWLLFAATLAVYAIMVGWSLPRISAAANGQVPFDMRPFGYSLDEARGFLVALPDDARQFYRGTQHLIDTLYPPLLAATLGLGIWALSPSSPRWLRPALASLAVAGMVFDLAENWLVAGLLALPAASVDAQSVAAASSATILKSIFTTLAMTTLLLLTLGFAWRRWRR